MELKGLIYKQLSKKNKFGFGPTAEAEVTFLDFYKYISLILSAW